MNRSPIRRLRLHRLGRSQALLIGMLIGALIFIIGAGIWLGVSMLRQVVTARGGR